MKATLKYSSITNPNAKSRTSTHTLPIGLKCHVMLSLSHKLIQWLKRRDLDERGGPFKSTELCEIPKEGLVKVRRGHIPQENAKEWRGRGMKETDTSAWFWGMMQTSLPWRTRPWCMWACSHIPTRDYHTSDVLLIAQLVYCSITRGLYNITH